MKRRRQAVRGTVCLSNGLVPHGAGMSSRTRVKLECVCVRDGGDLNEVMWSLNPQRECVMKTGFSSSLTTHFSKH